MKVAIIGSRNLIADITKYLPKEITEIISGGAVGIDKLAEQYADENNIPKRIIKPEYEKYGKFAPLKRNEIIVGLSELIIAIWDGKSRGTKYGINYAKTHIRHVNKTNLFSPNIYNTFCTCAAIKWHLSDDKIHFIDKES